MTRNQSRHWRCAIAAGACIIGAGTLSANERFTLDDVARVADVTEVEVSANGQWVAYTVATADLARDKTIGHVWLSRWDGSKRQRITGDALGESAPHFSPDGRALAFLSARGRSDEMNQLCLLPLAGGEAECITDMNGGVSDFNWAPDAKHLAIVARELAAPGADAKSDKDGKSATPPPIVIDRYQFMDDTQGYLGARWQHIYLVDVATHRTEPVTSGAFDDFLPAFAPDGRTLVFVSRRSAADYDRNRNWALYLAAAKADAAITPLTRYQGINNDPYWNNSRPRWSPNGKAIAYLEGGPQSAGEFSGHHVAVIASSGGESRPIGAALDRDQFMPAWSADGRSIYALVDEDARMLPYRFDVARGTASRLLDADRYVAALALGGDDHLALISSSDTQPTEVYAFEFGRSLRALSHQNDAWRADKTLPGYENLLFASNDGSAVHGLMLKPAGYVAGQRYPTILRIHGGPVYAFYHEFMSDWQLFAANGYAVVAANPRGSSGRGRDWAMAIWADWGHKDVEDVLAAVDSVVARGIADPQRLGVGGWSYGAMLTNYVIASDTRFKAAIAGAGTANIFGMYGTDMYVFDYEAELGKPWLTPENWLRVSYPFFHADRIKTPTLYMVGALDMNVPVNGSEQMYQALKSQGIDSQLVIYPGQYHEFDIPSYQRDRLERYLRWYGNYLTR